MVKKAAANGQPTEEYFVADSVSTPKVKLENLVLKPLPLSFSMIGIEVSICVICLIYQAKVGSRLKGSVTVRTKG